MSFAQIRGWMIMPLYVHDHQAEGEVAYVMADGIAVWERLHAAADLYHLKRVDDIYLLDEQQMSTYNFVRGQNDSRVQREIDFLGLHGVPTEHIHTVRPVDGDWLSSRSEAVGLQRALPGVTKLVVVTSAPHTRRCRLCFDRVFKDEANVSVCAATSSADSAETHFPIWIEYGKLIVYWFCV
ncbi:hypothetical protein Pla22_23020 [Rubripirellula amarantea]|uniref:Uncharacterized protein n=2 Tax=Rubripirellula amarantea TaxID=2527999 RepID=A0A5C5WXQ3_9BACT|nr:hypothetical protein Pla22_23020 [Rubripirellula amarantea]